MTSVLTQARADFHAELIEQGVLCIGTSDSGELVASNADGSQATSKAIALHIAQALGAPSGKKLPGQGAGDRFEKAVKSFLAATFPRFQSIRPGEWLVENVGGRRAEYHLAKFEPYNHLAHLARAIEKDPTLLSVLGNSYEISPDVFVVRAPVADATINRDDALVDGKTGLASVIRRVNQPDPIVHTVVSCKWTMRSDRAQNSRSEALNIIKNRKGRTPHIVVVTGEPTPSRLSSLALGTGEIDMMYHFALPELIAAVDASGNDEAQEMLGHLVDGKRLRDISDLPLDMAV